MDNRKRRMKRRGAGMNLLCDDLQEEILFRLSCKPLYRAKCVSKGWNDLISSAISHGRRQPLTTPAVFFYVGQVEEVWPKWDEDHQQEPDEIVRDKWVYQSASAEEEKEGDLSLEFFPFYNKKGIKIDNISDGLILCSLFNDIRLSVNYYLCNPLTKEWIAVCQKKNVEFDETTAALAFLTPPTYIARPYHFKLVVFHGFRKNLKISVFSSKTWKWVEKSPVNIAPRATDHSTPWLHLNGVVYKLTRPPYNSDSSVLSEALCYHIQENRFSSINLPKEDHMWISRRCGMQCTNGCLIVTAYVRKVQGTGKLIIWKLEDSSTGKWVPMHEIPTDDILREVRNCDCWYVYIATYSYLRDSKLFLPFGVRGMLPADTELEILYSGLISQVIALYDWEKYHDHEKSDFRALFLWEIFNQVFPFSPQPLPLFQGWRCKIN